MNDPSRWPMYDWALTEWVWSHEITIDGYPTEQAYVAGDETRLGRYLRPGAEIATLAKARTHVLIETGKLKTLGLIVGVDVYSKVWYLAEDEKIELYPGKPGVRPVPLEE